MDHFHQLALPEKLLNNLDVMQFTTPTPIQAQAIPHALEGRDILGSAQTGTGKTGAFGIPLAAKLLSGPRGSALVMTPTRELAMQVIKQLEQMLGKNSPIKTALLIGGEAMPPQLKQLNRRPRLIVGTPGRINDHLERGTLMLHDASFLVLDETDRMLDMGFSVQIEKILKFLPKKRQTLLFSATLPKHIHRIADNYLDDPVRVAVAAPSQQASNISHEVITLKDSEKYDRLLDELNNREGSIIVFMKTKYGTEKMATKLSKAGYKADAIHGDLRQNKRDRVIGAFRASKYRILVATDIAARGLDIPHVAHVINYDLPQSPEDYIHRIGRTARAGAKGDAICMITPRDAEQWSIIERLLDPEKAKADHTGYHPKPKGKDKGKGKPKNSRGNGGKGGKTQAAKEHNGSAPSSRPKRISKPRNTADTASDKTNKGKPSSKSGGSSSARKPMHADGAAQKRGKPSDRNRSGAANNSSKRPRRIKKAPTTLSPDAPPKRKSRG